MILNRRYNGCNLFSSCQRHFFGQCWKNESAKLVCRVIIFVILRPEAQSKKNMCNLCWPQPRCPKLDIPIPFLEYLKIVYVWYDAIKYTYIHDIGYDG
jgi:hypothetical protein